ncbi:hypothetical protein HPB48_009405 [Haemaphysalis longicornis]|uniref:Uncharacterized protein n=1 Tax=Haemaphysalis longicornis TaxID=44386 RepID=A0A9J6GJ38_HAELO|nr:hypothetical protein HPB48_009405 [Haemaphysalis longicornis]
MWTPISEVGDLAFAFERTLSETAAAAALTLTSNSATPGSRRVSGGHIATAAATRLSEEMASAMYVEVDEKEVDPALCTRANGWKAAGEKLKKSVAAPGTGGEAAKATPDVIGDTSCSSRTGVDGAERTKRPPIHKGRLLKKSRMPELPRGVRKIVVRPRGGLFVSEVTRVELSRALAAAAQVAENEAREDVVCPNGHQNILVISTPRRENADRYAVVERIDVRGTAYEVSTYEAAPYGTVKGVIRGIPLEDTAMDIEEQVVQDYNPTALQANRIGRSRSVVIVFAGKKVPRYVRLLSSSGNAGGKESTRDDKNEDEAASVEVLQADPNEATVRDQGRRRQGAPTVTGAAAPDSNHGCAAAAAAGRGALAQRWRRAATAARRRWGEGRTPGGSSSRRRSELKDDEASAREQRSRSWGRPGEQRSTTKKTTTKESAEIAELKKIIAKQNAQILEQNAQIKVLMSKIDKLVPKADQATVNDQAEINGAADAPRKMPRRRSPPPTPSKTQAPQKQEAMEAEEAQTSETSMQPPVEEQKELTHGETINLSGAETHGRST